MLTREQAAEIFDRLHKYSTADELERIVGRVFDRIASEKPRNSGAV